MYEILAVLFTFVIINCFFLYVILDNLKFNLLNKCIGLVLMTAITVFLKPIGFILGIISFLCVGTIMAVGTYQYVEKTIKSNDIIEKFNYLFLSLYLMSFFFLSLWSLIDIPLHWSRYSPLLSF